MLNTGLCSEIDFYITSPMSFDTYKAPLTIIPKKSLQLTSFIIGLHGIAILFALLALPVSIYYKLLIVLIIGVSIFYYYHLYIKADHSYSITAVNLTIENNWEIMTAKNEQYRLVQLLPSSLINRHLMILNFKNTSNQVYTLILFKDAINTDLAQKIRARIKVAGL